MTARALGAGRGTVIACSESGCTAKSTTGQVRIKDHRAWLKTQGWGRGSDPGQEYMPALPERTEIRTMNRGGAVIEYTIKLKPRPAREGRPNTKSKDLCPIHLAADRAAADARRTARQKQIAARDAGRIARATGKAS